MSNLSDGIRRSTGFARRGVTPTGVVIKRFDEIYDEIHNDLSDGWNFNTRLNPKSYLNVQVTSYADKIAELWEFGEQIYHSMYPFSAEDISLDNAVQYGGVLREEARPTYYPMHCECMDGTVIPKGTAIKSDTNPSIQFFAAFDTTVTRAAFNRVNIKAAALEPNEIYTVALDGNLYSYTSGPNPDENEILTGLAAAIASPDFAVAVNENYDGRSPYLSVQSVTVQTPHELVLSWNLTTGSVTGIVTFASEENGVFDFPNEVITQIVTAVPGLVNVTNRIKYIAGRLRETDAELRQSYADKIFIRSNRMLESIKSALLANVQGITAIACYQNDTNIVDADGRWPHCVEVVVEGGADYEIAMQIWDRKSDGIITFGNTEITIPGDEYEPVVIRFNRPVYVYVWFRILITMNRNEFLPPNYVDAIKAIIMEQMRKVEPGKTIVPQKFLTEIYRQVPGIAYIGIPVSYTATHSLIPAASSYEEQSVPITPRQRGITDETRIEVLLGG